MTVTRVRGVRLTPLLLLVVLLAATSLYRTASASPGVQAPDGLTECVEGMAGPYPCEGVDFYSFLSLSDLGGSEESEGANLWGWTDEESGKEYVIYAMTDATAFVDVSDPANPVYLGSLPTATIPADTYRDVKVYRDHAFIIADIPSQHGLQVFDLTQLRDVVSPPVTFSATAHYDGFGNAHNLFINQENGVAYVMRVTNPLQCDGAVAMIDVQNPTEPTFAGCINHGGLASDTNCVYYHGPDTEYQGHELCVTASDDNIVIDDVTAREAPVPIADLSYMDVARAHHTWLTEDHRYFLSADMDDEHHHGLNTRIFAWDFTDVDDPQLQAVYEGPTGASDHNVWVRGEYAYVGNFRAGLRILDLTRLEQGELSEAAFFDMVPGDDNVGHVGGAWAVYPFFDAGLIAVSEKEGGLYLLRHSQEATAITLAGAHAATRAPLPAIALLLGSLGVLALLRQARRERST